MNELTLGIQILIMLIDAGAGFRILYCIIKILFNQDDIKQYLKKITNLLVFVIYSTCILAILEAVKSYFIK